MFYLRLSTLHLPPRTHPHPHTPHSTYNYDTRIRSGVELMRACDSVLSRMQQLKMPLLVFHSTKDTLTDPDGSKLLVDSVKVIRVLGVCGAS